VVDPAVTTQVLGLSELERGSKRLFEHIDEHAKTAFRSTADQVATLIGRKQPRLTGRLAASATASGTDKGADVGIGGPGVPYAGWIEFGGTRGRPYVSQGRTVYPTAEASKHLFEQAGEQAAREQIGVMVWPKPTPKL
jgi:phage gpG-like protein